MTVTESAIDLARRLNAGEPVEQAIRAAGFDPDGENGLIIFPENPCLDWRESTILDCSWEELMDGPDVLGSHSITVEASEGRWRVWARREISTETVEDC